MARRRGSPGNSGTNPSEARRRWAGEREAHLRQTQAYSFLLPSRLRRSATKLPAELRFAQHLPASRLVRLLLLIGAPAYAVFQVTQGSDLGRAIGYAIVLAVVIFAASTFRLTVSNHGISLDIAGIRQVSSFGFVPLYGVRDARFGLPPADWPKATLKGGWWPGRQRVSVLHVDEIGVPRAFQVWVGDPEAFGVAVLGHDLSD